jgi:hypothetical protein
MSTIITPGFKLDSDINIFDFTRKMRLALKPVMDLHNYIDYIEEAVHSYDLDTDSRTFKEVLQKVITKIAVEDKEKDNVWSPGNFDCSVMFYYNPIRNETYALLRNFSSLAVDAFEKLPGVAHEFSYWDNSDSQLSHLTHAQWKDRETAWMEVLNRHDDVRLGALSSYFFGSYARFMMKADDVAARWDEVVKHVPKEEIRLRRIAAQIYGQSIGQLIKDNNQVNAYFSQAGLFTRLGKKFPLEEHYPDHAEKAWKEAVNILEEKRTISLV